MNIENEHNCLLFSGANSLLAALLSTAWSKRHTDLPEKLKAVALSCFIRTGWLLGTLLISLALEPSARPQPPLERFHFVHPAMGTEYAIDLYAGDEAAAEHAADLAFDEVDRIDDLLSNYKPASELSRLDREAVHGPVTTDPETFRFLERSVYWSRASDGAFDITVGPLLRAWGFFFHGGRVPSAAELTAIKQNVGWQRLLLDPARRSVNFADHAPLDLDPGSIGKGFAVDAVVPLLREAGVTAALISAGNSTIYALGAPPCAAGWPVHIPDPRHPGQTAETVLLKDTSLSTGACTEKFFIKDGHRYCHIFDPRTMRPVEGVLQTTVIDPSATDSDALSTVTFVLSSDDARRVLAAHPNAQALVFRDAPANDGCVAIHWSGNPCGTTPERR